VSVHKVRFFVIPAKAGIQVSKKIMDARLRTSGMTFLFVIPAKAGIQMTDKIHE